MCAENLATPVILSRVVQDVVSRYTTTLYRPPPQLSAKVKNAKSSNLLIFYYVHWHNPSLLYPIEPWIQSFEFRKVQQCNISAMLL